jgi:hypothetical protein
MFDLRMTHPVSVAHDRRAMVALPMARMVP